MIPKRSIVNKALLWATVCTLSAVVSLAADARDRAHKGLARSTFDWDYDGARILGKHGPELSPDICLWSAEDGRQIHRMSGHADPIFFVGFSADGMHAVSSSWRAPGELGYFPNDTSVRVWDLRTGRQVAKLDRQVMGDMSPDGTRLLTFSEVGDNGMDFDAAVWSTATWEKLFSVRLSGESNPLRDRLRFTPDGKHFVWFRLLATLYSSETGVEIGRSPERGSNFAFYGDSGAIVNHRHSGVLSIINLKESRVERQFTVGSLLFYNFSADGETLFGQVFPNTEAWNVKSGQRIVSMDTKEGVLQILLSKAANRAIINRLIHEPEAEPYGQALLFELPTFETIAEIRRDGGQNLLAFSPDGATFIMLHYPEALTVYDSKNGESLRTIRLER